MRVKTDMSSFKLALSLSLATAATLLMHFALSPREKASAIRMFCENAAIEKRGKCISACERGDISYFTSRSSDDVPEKLKGRICGLYDIVGAGRRPLTSPSTPVP